MNSVLLVFALLVLLRWLGIDLLERLNLRHASQRIQADAERGDAETLRKSLDYTRAKSRWFRIESAWSAILLVAVIGSGLLPWLYGQTARLLSPSSVWVDGLYLFGVMVLASAASLPFDWYRQFRLEEAFGFNTSTQAVWWSDRLKMLVLSFVLMYPLLVLILFLVRVTGNAWWVWTWAVVMAYQLLLFLIAPKWILPLFNKFTPLSDESLRDSIEQLANRADFRFRSIETMDGSKRSTHSNAFFTGVGKNKKIALFDTILAQMSPAEIQAVVAHEIGHDKKRHIPKTIAWNGLLLFLELLAASVLIRQEWLIAPFGFVPGRFATDILVVGIFSGLILFWLSPLENWLSRKHEYEADAFAARLMEDPQSMIRALLKLQSKNLSNPYPHPLYSFFYYSHPTVRERVDALGKEE